MITFCKKSVHSFLRLTHSKDNGTLKPSPSPPPPPSRCRNIPTPAIDGLSLIAVTREIQKPTNVIESTIFKLTTPIAAAAATSEVMKKDTGGIGFIDDVGGEVDGLMSCTESLGFESSDERRTDEKIEDNNEFCSRTRSMAAAARSKWRRTTAAVRREKKKFPPPLSSLNKNGQPSFYLRAVRKEGRLELTEVRIDRPEILRASREDGRLRLHLIQTLEEEKEVEEEEERELEEKIEEERSGSEWVFPVSNGGGSGEGLRRCHELVNRHHHHLHHHQVWSQQCVTTT